MTEKLDVVVRLRMNNEYDHEIEAAAEIERLRAENQSWRSLDQIRLDLLRQSAAEVQRLQALIDAYAEAEFRLREDTVPLGPEWRAVKASYNAAEDALLAAATKKEDDRG